MRRAQAEFALVLALLGALIGFVVSIGIVSVLPFALSSGGARGVTFAEFSTSVIDPTRFDLDSRCGFKSGSDQDFPTGALKFFDCPLHVAGPASGSLADSNFGAVTPGTGPMSALARPQVVGVGDFYGQDIRVPYRLNSGFFRMYVGDFDTNHWFVISTKQAALGGGSEGVIDVVPDEFDPYMVRVFINDRELAQGAQPWLVGAKKVQIGFDMVGSGVSFFGGIERINFEPRFGCQVNPGELLVKEDLAGGDVVDIFSFAYPVVRFCEELPVVVVDAAGMGATTALGPYFDWSAGKSRTVGEGQVWTVTYVMKNQKLDGTAIFEVGCQDGVINAKTGECLPKLGTVTLCRRGEFDSVRNACILTADEECPGVIQPDGRCVVFLPVDQICQEGTLKTQEGTCLPSSNECPVLWAKVQISSGEFSCIAPGSAVSRQASEILTPVVESSRGLFGGGLSNQRLILALVFGLVGLGLAVVLWRKKR